MQQIVLTDKKVFSATEVKDVLSFSEKDIKLVLTSGKRLFIEGGGLKITGFDKSCGKFSAEGDVSAIRFSGAKENVLKRMFK
ncbi:MAG: YabP/YqfC family sporulation protein [Clostridia bacterium]|nr:YabP/YqfC family sporulation protein [Clostridia bacterium]